MRDSVVFYRSWWNATKRAKDPECRIEIFDAIFSYALDGVRLDNLSDMADMVMDMVIPLIDENFRRRDNGNFGGRPKKETNGLKNDNHRLKEESETDNHSFENEKPNVNVSVTESVNEAVSVKGEGDENSFTSSPKRAYGSYKNVFLTDDEVFEISEKYPDIGSYAINRLSEYMEGNGKKYPNHFVKVMEWLKSDEEKFRTQKKEDDEKEIAKKQRESYKDEWLPFG